MRNLLLLIFTILYTQAFAQIGVNTEEPKATLEVKLNENLDKQKAQGFLPPRMSTERRDKMKNVTPGVIIYNLTTDCLEVYNGSKWICMNCCNKNTNDGNGDTTGSNGSGGNGSGGNGSGGNGSGGNGSGGNGSGGNGSGGNGSGGNGSGGCAAPEECRPEKRKWQVHLGHLGRPWKYQPELTSNSKIQFLSQVFKFIAEKEGVDSSHWTIDPSQSGFSAGIYTEAGHSISGYNVVSISSTPRGECSEKDLDNPDRKDSLWEKEITEFYPEGTGDEEFPQTYNEVSEDGCAICATLISEEVKEKEDGTSVRVGLYSKHQYACVAPEEWIGF